MYATGTGGSKATRAAYDLTDRKHRTHRSRPETAGGGAKRVRNAFLKQRIRPIAPVSVTRDEYVVGHNYITRENYEYLLASAGRYAKLSGKELGHDPGSSTGEGIANLYKELSAMVGEDINVNIELEDGKLVFVLWQYYCWGEYNFYWIPVGFVEKLNPRLRRIAISFLHLFMRSNGLETTNTSRDFENVCMWYDERSYDPAEENPEELARMAVKYSADGKVGTLMAEIERQSYYKRLGPALDRYVPQSEYETELTGLMKRGLRFIGKGKSIMSYAYDPFMDEENVDYCGINPDSMIMLTHDVMSDFEREVRYYIQEEINNNYEVMATAKLTLRPDGNDVFSFDSYPTEFYSYLDDLLNFLTGGPQWTRIY
jgi:hypothetical protein